MPYSQNFGSGEGSYPVEVSVQPLPHSNGQPNVGFVEHVGSENNLDQLISSIQQLYVNLAKYVFYS